MDLLTYISDMERRRSLADATDSSPDYLWQIATNRRQAGPRLAKAIEEKTGGQVARSSVRPDLWTPPKPIQARSRQAERRAG